MKKVFLTIITLCSLASLSFANQPGDDLSPYYIKELKSLVRKAPTVYSANIANHYLNLAVASKKIEDQTFTLSTEDFTALRTAFSSAPQLVSLLKTMENSAK